VPHLLRHGTSVYTVSSEGPALTSHSGIRTGDARIIRSLRLRSNHCATRAVGKTLTLAISNERLVIGVLYLTSHVFLVTRPLYLDLKLWPRPWNLTVFESFRVRGYLCFINTSCLDSNRWLQWFSSIHKTVINPSINQSWMLRSSYIFIITFNQHSNFQIKYWFGFDTLFD
jgi:hypothetical protein